MEKYRSQYTDFELEQQATDYRNNGQVDKAVAAYKELIKRFEDEGKLLRAAEMQHMVGVSYKVGNHTEQSLEALGDALHRYQELNDAVHVGRAERDIGTTYQYAKDYAKARPLLERSVATLEKTDAQAELGISEVKLGHLFHEVRMLDEAERWIEKGINTMRQTNHWFYQATALLHLADLSLTKGQYPEALAAAEASERLLYDHDAEEVQKRRVAQLNYLKEAIYKGLHDNEAARMARDKADVFARMLDEASQTYLHSQL